MEKEMKKENDVLNGVEKKVEYIKRVLKAKVNKYPRYFEITCNASVEKILKKIDAMQPEDNRNFCYAGEFYMTINGIIKKAETHNVFGNVGIEKASPNLLINFI